jgi:hypothetical protein
MSSSVFVRENGFGAALLTEGYERIVCSSSRLEPCVPRRMHRSVSFENQRSTRFSYETDVDVK